jgi:F-type H+-transporting ATPase subunit b
MPVAVGRRLHFLDLLKDLVYTKVKKYKMMLFLADFSVIRPEPGLLIWTTLIFLLFWGLMGKFAFKPIQNALKEREQDIQNSLDAAKKAKEDISSLQSNNENLLKQAAEERAGILKEAKEAKESIINEAREKAKEEAQKIVQAAKLEIEHQRMEMLTNVRNDIGLLSIEIAEKLIHQRLSDKQESLQLTQKLVEEIRFEN